MYQYDECFKCSKSRNREYCKIGLECLNIP